MASQTSPYALAAEEGEAFWFGDFLITVKASGEQTGGRFSLLEQTAAKGAATPLHIHPHDDETFYVLEGDLTFFLDGQSPISATTGSFVHISGTTKHALQVDSEIARVIDITTPRHESFLRAAGVAAEGRALPPRVPPDMERLTAAAREYGVEILGPPPGEV
ncbi:quercetin 2,3-dioxygenase [Amycolatopsis taiwanensis]|uniref:Cupin n=1 Tax=Amycolatopsis taiwanensis TaxID=342230 RepID=A0A9W6VMG4_9PSEU|nr:quercetin 2,3-dioxygenase [Amycolatopsis taiwanensis]GLY71511.1 cupin [Amycolatopsis taiwanensis]